MKYKLTDESRDTDGVTLYRIEALRAFGNVIVGELGGWVESEANLSHDGNAWVFRDARVYGDAWVSDNAWVSCDARVYGNALVYGNAWVFGDALVSGDAVVSGNARIYDNAVVSGNARIYDNAVVSGNSVVSKEYLTARLQQKIKKQYETKRCP